MRTNINHKRRYNIMLTTPTIEILKTLKLHGMLEALKEQQKAPAVQALSFEERIALIVDRERLYRDNQGRVSKTSTTRPRVAWTNARSPPSPPASGSGVLITGTTGTGKTWLSCALAQQTCRQGASVMYWRVPRLLEELRVSHGDGSYIKLLKTLSKASLILLDDWGLTRVKLQSPAAPSTHCSPSRGTSVHDRWNTQPGRW
jgi:IstB-like ATP binding protein